MREKYIKFFKKELVFLLILLIVVCFSFGITYSNFVYNSDSYRAVEMFTSKLNYELDNKTFNILPGNNIIRFKVKSLNSIDSYFKISSDKKVDIRFYNDQIQIIKANETVNIELLVFNPSKNTISINLDVYGGFITNTYDDVKVTGFEVTNRISIGDAVTIDGEVYKLLDINNDGSYVLLSNPIEYKTVNGSIGYNSFIHNVNEDVRSNLNGKVLNLEDIEKYTKNTLVEYTDSHYYSDAYFPTLWGAEKDTIINNEKNDDGYTKSEGYIVGNHNHASSIVVKDIKLNNIEFKNEKYNRVFLNSNYLLATRYQHTNNDNAEWGILSIEDNEIKLNKLFESNETIYDVNGNIRILINVSSQENLFNKEI